MQRRDILRRPFRLRALPAAASLGAGLAALAIASLVAAQKGGDGVIHACVSKSGEVRIVGPNDTCAKNQTALDWNREGPQGPPGRQGEPGEPALFATADDRCTGNPNEIDESRTTPGVELQRLDRFGRYNVGFPRSLAGCAGVASLRALGDAGGAIDSTVLDDPDNTVRVNTAIDPEGDGDFLPLDLPFTVAVFC